jgi:hypothetical protein
MSLLSLDNEDKRYLGGSLVTGVRLPGNGNIDDQLVEVFANFNNPAPSDRIIDQKPGETEIRQVEKNR